MNGVSVRKREIELDLLRILALLAVISVHCTGMGNTDAMPMSDPAKRVLVFFDSIVTWQIPVYVMISGRFFLDPDRTVTKERLLKAIGRIAVAFIVWDVVYQLYYIASGTYSGLNWKGIISEAFIGPYHFWFLFMIIGLYAVTPFLRKIAADKKLSEYFIALFFVFECLYGYGVSIPGVGGIISDILDKTNFHLALGYSGYYVLGYYLHKHDISKRCERGLYCLAAILIVLTSGATIYRSILDGANNEVFTGYLKPNIIIIACGIYTFFVKRMSRVCFSEKWIYLIEKLSEYSFGVYLLHALLIELSNSVGVSPILLTPLIMQPLIVILVFAITNVAVGLIRGIPWIGKRIT